MLQETLLRGGGWPHTEKWPGRAWNCRDETVQYTAAYHGAAYHGAANRGAQGPFPFAPFSFSTVILIKTWAATN